MLTRRQALLAPLAGSLLAKKSAGVPQGLYPVMLTPFKDDKSIDWKGLDALTDWYFASGAVGLFACCASSEVWELTVEERLQVAERVIRRAAGKPVVVGGMPGFERKPVREFNKALHGMGATAAVLTTCQVAEQTDPDSLWKDRVEGILADSPEIPFGLYEAPRPYKRLLSIDLTRWAARSGRFVFHKDTSCKLETVADRVAATKGSPFGIFNAHVPILVDSIRHGGPGFSGVAANAYPNLVAAAVRAALTHKEPEADRLQTFLTRAEKTLSVRYPISAKRMAAWAGVPIGPTCRKQVVEMTPEQITTLRGLRAEADRVSGS